MIPVGMLLVSSAVFAMKRLAVASGSWPAQNLEGGTLRTIIAVEHPGLGTSAIMLCVCGRA